jgi:hypothetical protein
MVHTTTSTQHDSNNCYVRTAEIDGQAKISLSGQHIAHDEHGQVQLTERTSTAELNHPHRSTDNAHDSALFSGAELKPQRIDLRILLKISKILTSHGNIKWTYI